MARRAAPTEAAASAPPLCGFVDAFLSDLKTAVQTSVATATSDLEDAIHNKIQFCVDKEKQARQLAVVRVCSSAYMTQVQSAFAKNFDKFELYVRRNIVTVPPAIRAMVEQYHRDQLEKAASASMDAQLVESAEDAALPPLQRREKQLEQELRVLRARLREMEQSTQVMALEEQALDARTEQFQAAVSKLSFLDDVAGSTISPLKRTAEQVSLLRRTLETMDELQTSLEQDTHGFKRQKLATRASYKNLRHRFLARTATVAFASLDDLQQLRSSLASIDS